MSNSTPQSPKYLSKEELERHAEAVLRSHGLYSVPVDPIRIAQALGIKVSNAHFSHPNISGMIAQREGTATILVNDADSPPRKRFSIAHELGHHFLHLSDSDGEFVTSALDLFREAEPGEEQGSDRWAEWQANYFAGALLMPKKLLLEEYGKHPDVQELARLFRVSVQAMEVRLRQLGAT